MIKYIDIGKLHPHPDNPRKDLGNLSELVESIKVQGILQNLTVVELSKYEKDYYRIVIGHRRYEAAKQAGLKELPCIISTMDYKTQVGTMLLENIQRADLTIYEQAQGFQMMMDLGDSISDISEKTGFSDTTVRRRIKLMELDQDKLKEAAARNATISDYVELEKIKDIKLRNEVLDKIGTSDFKWKLRSAIEDEKRAEKRKQLISELEKFAKQVEDPAGLQYVKTYYSDDDKVEVPEDADTVEYFFWVSTYGAITVYKKPDENKNSAFNNSEWEKKEQKRREKREALEKLSKQAYELRSNFVKNVSSTTVKNNIDIIVETLVFVRAIIYPYDLDLEDYAEFCDIKLVEYEEDEDDEQDVELLYFDTIKEYIKKQPELHLLITTYLMLDSPDEKYYRWSESYENNERLNATYNLLEQLGYEISTEEKKLKDGTHELFQS